MPLHSESFVEVLLCLMDLEIRAQGLSNNQMLESSVCCHSKQTSALFLSESSFVDGEEKLHTIAFYFMKMR